MRGYLIATAVVSLLASACSHVPHEREINGFVVGHTYELRVRTPLLSHGSRHSLGLPPDGDRNPPIGTEMIRWVPPGTTVRVVRICREETLTRGSICWPAGLLDNGLEIGLGRRGLRRLFAVPR